MRTPNLDGQGVLLTRHYNQAAPCSPGRACLYTGTYQMTDRVVGNGMSLDHRFDTVALAARRAGYRPTLFGYTDQGIDPRSATGGRPAAVDLRGDRAGFRGRTAAHRPFSWPRTDRQEPWIEWLRGLGYDLRDSFGGLSTEPERPAEHGVTAFLTDRVLEWLRGRNAPWLAHVSYLRPHDPYAAAGRWSTAYSFDAIRDPVSPPERPIPPTGRLAERRAASDDELREIRAQYFGMVSHVDEELGRLFSGLKELGMWDDTCIVVTSDQGEQSHKYAHRGIVMT